MGDAPPEGSRLCGERIFPVDNPTTPYWRTELHRFDSYRSTKELPSECDIAIIGSGMAGTSTAYHLVKAADKKNPPSIVLLEARQLCSGATARNGGHAKIKTDTLMTIIDRHGLEAAMEYRDLVIDNIYATKQTAERENIDCEFELRRSFDVFIDESESKEIWQRYEKCLKAEEKWTKDISFTGKDHAEQVTAMKGAKAAFNTPACSFWPYKFVSQLLGRLIDKEAINFQTETPVTEITQSGGFNILHTYRGALKAKKLVFATNAYTSGILSTYEGNIVPYRGTAVHITPRWRVSPHLSNTYNIHYPLGDVIEPVDYFNPRPEGGIVVGGGKWTYAPNLSRWYNNWDDSTLLEETKPHFQDYMQKFFHGWESSGAHVDMMWTGIMAATPNELPHIGEVPGQEGGQYILAGFNGGGNDKIFLCAKGVAKMILDGCSYEDTGLPRLFKTSEERLQ